MKAQSDSSLLQLPPAGKGGHTTLPRASAGTVLMVSKWDGACATWEGLWDPKSTKRKCSRGFASRVAATWAKVSLGRGACGASCGSGKVTERGRTYKGPTRLSRSILAAPSASAGLWETTGLCDRTGKGPKAHLEVSCTFFRAV